MKKLFVSILALAAFAACQSDFNDVNLDAPQGGIVVSQGEHTIYAEVGVGEADTKATYDDDLKATWEEDDQIALLQEHADYNKPFGGVKKLNIKEGWGTNSAKFNGDILVDATSPRVYHIAYPASAVSFSTNLSLTKSSDSSYETKESTPGVAYFRATANYEYKYISNLNVNVPTEQNGKWEPYMYASTSEAVNAEYIGSKTLTTLTGAIAIRAFEADGVTPKQLKSITITSSDAAIAGAFIGEAISTSTLSVTGDYTSKTYSTEIDSDFIIEGRNKAKAAANELLESKAQSTEPTSTSVTKAMSLSFAGNERTITLTNLENIPMDSEGYYTYYINVAPATVGSLEIEVMDTKGGQMEHIVNNHTFTAGHRRGYMLTWEEATLIPGTIETWYDNWNTSSFQLEGNTIYARNIGIDGIPADQVLALGVEIDGTLHAPSAQAGVLSQKELKIEGVSNGTYSICTYAKIMLNGKETVLKGDVKTITVTPIPTATYNVYTSYSKNGAKALNNDVYGNEIRAKVDLSDIYIQTNFVQSATFTYGGSTANLTPGQEWKTTLGYGAHSTSIKVVLKNGYTLTSGNYTSHITGIPFTMTTSSNADGWSTSGTINWNTDGGVRLGKNHALGGQASITKTFHIPSDITVKVTSNGTVRAMVGQTNTATITVGNTTVVSKSKKGGSDSFSCSAESASMSSSSQTVKCNSSYNYSNSYVVVKSLQVTYAL